MLNFVLYFVARGESDLVCKPDLSYWGKCAKWFRSISTTISKQPNRDDNVQMCEFCAFQHLKPNVLLLQCANVFRKRSDNSIGLKRQIGQKNQKLKSYPEGGSIGLFTTRAQFTQNTRSRLWIEYSEIRMWNLTKKNVAFGLFPFYFHARTQKVQWMITTMKTERWAWQMKWIPAY